MPYVITFTNDGRYVVSPTEPPYQDKKAAGVYYFDHPTLEEAKLQCNFLNGSGGIPPDGIQQLLGDVSTLTENASIGVDSIVASVATLTEALENVKASTDTSRAALTNIAASVITLNTAIEAISIEIESGFTALIAASDANTTRIETGLTTLNTTLQAFVDAYIDAHTLG